MKNTLLKILCVVFSIIMAVCVFAACGKNSDEDGSSDADVSDSDIGGDEWSQGLPGYVQIELTDDEITDFVKQTLGDKCPKNFDGDLSTLSPDELNAVSGAAIAAGYNIYRDGDKKIKINKTVSEEEAKTDAVLTNVEVVELVKEALGDDTPENFNGDINTLSDKQLDKVVKRAKDKGLVVNDNREITTTAKSGGKKDSGKKDNKKNSASDYSVPEVPTSKISIERVTKVYEQPTTVASSGGSSSNNNSADSGNYSGNSGNSGNSGSYETPATRYVAPANSGNNTTNPTAPPSNEPTTRNQPVSNKTQPVCVSKMTPGDVYTYNGTEYSSSCYCENDGGVVVGGIDQSGGKEFKKPCGVVAKISKNGNVIWSKNIGGDEMSAVTDVAILKDDSIIATGYTVSMKFYDAIDSDKNMVNTFYAKFSKNGDMKWIKVINASNESTNGYAVAAAPDGGFYLGGYSKASDGDFASYQGAIKAFVFKYDSDGKFLKGHALTASKSNSCRSICVNDAGEVFATFQTATATGDYALIEGIRENVISSVIVKYDADLKVKWFCPLSDNGAVNTDAITYSNDGGCVIAGEVKCSSKGNTHSLSGIYNGGEPGSYDGIVIKIGPTGKVTWITSVMGFKNDYVTDICRLAGGYCYGICGYTTSTNRDFQFADGKSAGDFDAYSFTISASGVVSDQTKIYFGGSAVETPKAICARETFTKDELKKIKKDGAEAFPITEEMFIAGYTNSKDGYFKDCAVHSDNGVPFVVTQQATVLAGDGKISSYDTENCVGSQNDFAAWKADL